MPRLSFTLFAFVVCLTILAIPTFVLSRWNLGYIETRIIAFEPRKLTMSDSMQARLSEINQMMSANPGLPMVVEYPLTSNKPDNHVFKKQGAVVLQVLRDSFNMDASRFRFKSAVTLSPDNVRVRMAYTYE